MYSLLMHHGKDRDWLLKNVPQHHEPETSIVTENLGSVLLTTDILDTPFHSLLYVYHHTIFERALLLSRMKWFNCLASMDKEIIRHFKLLSFLSIHLTLVSTVIVCSEIRTSPLSSSCSNWSVCCHLTSKKVTWMSVTLYRQLQCTSLYTKWNMMHYRAGETFITGKA